MTAHSVADDVPRLRVGSMCTGYGGLDLAVHAVLGGDLAWLAELDPDASAVLAHRFPDVPNFGDLTAVDWSATPPVDVLTAGFPCQPVSDAGKRKGVDDERWLWDDICAAVGRMDPRPGLLVLENVRGLLSANRGDAMARVIQGLASLGYVGRYRLLRASDVGAPHRRERVSSPRGLLPTPVATDDDWRGPESMARKASSRDYLDLITAVTLLPTPSRSAHDDGKDPDVWRARRERMRDRHGVGIGTPPLPILVTLLAAADPRPSPESPSRNGAPTRPRSGDGNTPSDGRPPPLPNSEPTTAPD